MAAVGVSTPRRDSGPKVRGATRFAADIAVPGLLHARLVLSHEAHAMISGIGTDAALALPGVVAVLTAADLPLAATGRGRTYEPLAREEVVYAGQPVALVVAESEAAAEDGAELVEVELDPLEPVLDLEAATRPGAPRARVKVAADDAGSDLGDAHASVATSGVGDEEELSDNVLDTARLENGDVDAALAASHVVVKGSLSTPWMYQGYIEPQTATAWVDSEGQLVVSSATQAPFSTRDSLAKLLGMPVGQVRVRSEALGGA
ncbi:MAG: xanthine dehydrogenase family protein molybdopterin-binding subunit, partial [Solirubrobacteraceae bacterium]